MLRRLLVSPSLRSLGQAAKNAAASHRGRVATVAAGFGAVLTTSFAPIQVKAEAANLEGIRKAIEDIMEDENAYNPSHDRAPGVAAGGGDVGPMLVRLAWHCAGTWDKDAQNGGSDGATMRFPPESEHGGNAGLEHARNLLEPVKAANPWISYADLYIYAGKVAIEAMGGPEIGFNLGRTDADGPPTSEADTQKKGWYSPDGRLPDGDKGADHVRAIFYRMGFNDQEIVALCGAHSMGRCHTDRSGFWGPWSYSPSTFSNEYFRLLIEETWTPKVWNGPPQLENSNGQLMMLTTDMALIEDAEFAKWVRLYKEDEELFFSHFAEAFQKLCELGTNVSSTTGTLKKRFCWQWA